MTRPACFSARAWYWAQILGWSALIAWLLFGLALAGYINR